MRLVTSPEREFSASGKSCSAAEPMFNLMIAPNSLFAETVGIYLLTKIWIDSVFYELRRHFVSAGKIFETRGPEPCHTVRCVTHLECGNRL